MIGRLGLLAAFVVTALSTQAQALSAEWEDLHGRCFDAVTAGERLDLSGLEDRLPSFEALIVEDPVLGERVDLRVLRSGGRTVPVGIWGAPGGAFEMHLLEYPTRAGFRAICEVRTARVAGLKLDQSIGAALRDLFDDTAAERGDEPLVLRQPSRMAAYRGDPANPRECAVVTSFATDEGGYLRSSVSEAAGTPDCGGPSLATFRITPHGVLPPTSQPGGATE